jgi:hypothetical protein
MSASICSCQQVDQTQSPIADVASSVFEIKNNERSKFRGGTKYGELENFAMPPIANAPLLVGSGAVKDTSPQASYKNYWSKSWQSGCAYKLQPRILRERKVNVFPLKW